MINQAQRVTLKDIAEEIGCSVNTVSRALSGKRDISQATRKRIQKKAKEMGYIRDTVASSMRSGMTGMIALITGDISNPFLSTQAKEIERSAKEYSYTTIVLNTDENSEQERSAIMSAYSKRVDGIVICPTQKDLDNMKLLQDIGVPFVLLGRYFKNFKADSVVWDDVKAGEIATNHMIGLGHRNILYIGGPHYISSAEERFQGYLEAHRKAKLEPIKGLMRQTDIMSGSSMNEIKRVIAEGHPFTAIVTFSDLMAYEAIRTIREVKYTGLASVPVVGIDDIQSKIMLPIEFSSVGSVDAMGYRAVELLMKKIQYSSDVVERIVLDVKLIHHNT